MYKNLFKKVPLKLCAATVCSTIVLSKFTDLNGEKLHAAGGYNYCRKYYPASSEYPDLSRHRSLMARNLTEHLYSKLRDLRTRNGFNIDDAIQTGVDNIGTFSFTGIVAGDEETYETFKEIFDKIISQKHNFNPETQIHKTDLDISKLENAQFDTNYVLSTRIRTLRNIRGYCMPSFCTRGERRDVESIIVKSLYNLDDLYSGTYYALKDLSIEEEATLTNKNIYMERPFYPTDVSANLARDWPDARGIWLNNDQTLYVQVNGRDHVLISEIDKNGDFKECFTKFVNFINKFESSIKNEKWQFMHNKRLGYLTTDPKDLGTALKLCVRIKLPKLANDGRLAALLKALNLNHKYRVIKEEKQDNESISDKIQVLEISSIQTLGKSEVEISQSFANSINKLIETEKQLENGGNLDDVLYG